MSSKFNVPNNLVSKYTKQKKKKKKKKEKKKTKKKKKKENYKCKNKTKFQGKMNKLTLVSGKPKHIFSQYLIDKIHQKINNQMEDLKKSIQCLI